MNLISRNKNGGYSLVEVLVAITVLMIALIGPLTIAYSGLRRATFSAEETTAIFMAQEGGEAIVKLREDAALAASSYTNVEQIWRDIFIDTDLDTKCLIGSANYCGVTIGEDGAVNTASVYLCSGTNCLMKYNSALRVPFKQGSSATGNDTIFTRRLQITVSGNEYARIKTYVSWGSDSSQSIELETYVYNIYYEQ